MARYPDVRQVTPPYQIPAAAVRTEIVIKKSRFLTTVRRAPTVDAARAAIAELRVEMSDANHHVYAFRVGFGKTVTEGMSDDGEPRGTAGPPTLAVVRGSDVGDIVLVTARYFGGTKLGTGGLVRAYTESAQLALSQLQTELKVERQLVGIELPYSLYNVVKLLVDAHNGIVEEEVFEAAVLITVRFVVSDLDSFTAELRERSSGAVNPVRLD
ncbi:MAG: YigZ family protein [Chloroflexi bacterium]|nr:YigZ family protein [Chloroflexota bacterium]